MKKLFFLVAMVATISMLASCGGKDKDHSEDEMEDLTLVVSTSHFA
jgi:ABC-type phosphate/phosphonate transport system substrate-binding protein